MRHILVPLDFSQAAQVALETAVALCQDMPGRITLLHILHADKTTGAMIGLDAIGYLSQTLESPSMTSGCAPSFDADQLERLAQQKLEERVDPSWRERIPIETAFAAGSPSTRIVQYARDHNVDMIVMGTHGRGPVARFFLGSVAEGVVRSAHCPVLTVRGEPEPCSLAAKP